VVSGNSVLGQVIDPMLPNNLEKFPIEKLMFILDQGAVEVEDDKVREKGHRNIER
jgi:hypothetical protein